MTVGRARCLRPVVGTWSSRTNRYHEDLSQPPPIWFSCVVFSPSRRSASARGPGALFATAAVAGVLAVWAAAAPRQADPIPGLVRGVELVQAPADDNQVGRPGLVLGLDTSYLSRSIDDRLAVVLAWTLVTVAAALALLLVLVLGRALLRAWRSRNRPPPDDDGLSDVVPAAVLADQAERLTALGTGSPREGIVAAWARLEASIALAGVPLTQSRTSTEVVLATLRGHHVSADTLEELASLFREARYSRHVLDEEDRRRADAALRRIDAELEEQLGLAEPVGGHRE